MESSRFRCSSATSTSSRWARATCRISICSRTLARFEQPILLKRGRRRRSRRPLLSAEYLMAGGNHEVIICEAASGPRDLYAQHARHLRHPGDARSFAPANHRRPEPRHRRRDKVSPMARAAVAACAGRPVIEVHHDPERALCDGAQSLLPAQFDKHHGPAAPHRPGGRTKDVTSRGPLPHHARPSSHPPSSAAGSSAWSFALDLRRGRLRRKITAAAGRGGRNSPLSAASLTRSRRFSPRRAVRADLIYLPRRSAGSSSFLRQQGGRVETRARSSLMRG